MIQSLLLAAFAFGVFALGAASVARSARRRNRPNKGYLQAAALFAAGLGVATFIFIDDTTTRRTTLFETRIASDTMSHLDDGSPYREVDFEIEHPGVPHQLILDPEPDGRQDVPPVTVDYRLQPADAEVLTQGTAHFTPVTDYQDRAPPGRTDTEWASWRQTFTPTTAGHHVLRITFRSKRIAAVRVRIADPRRSDP